MRAYGCPEHDTGTPADTTWTCPVGGETWTHEVIADPDGVSIHNWTRTTPDGSVDHGSEIMN